MKTFKVSAFCAFMVLSGQTFAKPIKSEVTPIVFAKEVIVAVLVAILAIVNSHFILINPKCLKF